MAARPAGGWSVGRFLTPRPLPEPLLFAELLRRRMRVRLGEMWIADSEDVVATNGPCLTGRGADRRWRPSIRTRSNAFPRW
jgi:hypothetical protein